MLSDLRHKGHSLLLERRERFHSDFEFTYNWDKLKTEFEIDYWQKPDLPAHYTYIQHFFNSIVKIGLKDNLKPTHDIKAKDFYYTKYLIMDLTNTQIRDFCPGAIDFIKTKTTKSDREDITIKYLNTKLQLSKNSNSRVKSFWFDALHNALPVCYRKTPCSHCGEPIHALHFTSDCHLLPEKWRPEISFLHWIRHVDSSLLESHWEMEEKNRRRH